MTAIYIHRDVLVSTPAASVRPSDAFEASLVSGAAEALDHLVDAGHELHLLGALPTGAVDQLPMALEPASEADVDRARVAWLIVADPEECRTRRRAGLRTIYVGPRRPPQHRPTGRCDLEARDLSSAVIEILTQDAMTPLPGSRA